jgi:hypothetical protein
MLVVELVKILLVVTDPIVILMIKLNRLFVLTACGSLVVKALFYKPEGRGFETYEVNEFFQFT